VVKNDEITAIYEIFKMNRTTTSFLSPVSPFKWDNWFGGSRWWHCGLA